MRFAGFALAVAFLFLRSPLTAQVTPVYGDPAQEKLLYLLLEHRSSAEMKAEDAALLNARNQELLAAATFYGYEMKSNDWSYEQSVCPLMPDSLMLRYSSKDAAGADSLFVALVPRSAGRVRIVPVLTHGATQFTPAAKNPRNFQLFNQMVPADVAQANSQVSGQWLLLSVCYAEMTGAQPQIPNRPEVDLRLIPTSSPMLRATLDGAGEEVRFAAPISPTQYTAWSVNYDKAGRIVNASADTHSFTPPVEVADTPPPTGSPIAAPPPPVKVIPASHPQADVIPQSPTPALQAIPAQPPPEAKAIAPRPLPQAKQIRVAKEPEVRIMPDAPPPPVKVIPAPPPPTVIPDSQPQ
ncbi:hypothetical protein [Acidobacterium sp. S8]|uniref:hypothetical protein n=1 Tax=Acidobacterium sp. S8 TaxID=1641854 RepID=UPI00131BFC75|nr:hypothetical protein [Acidobacterium sp. S8]